MPGVRGVPAFDPVRHYFKSIEEGVERRHRPSGRMRKKDRILLAALIVAIVAELIFRFTAIKLVKDEVLNDLVITIITRAVTGICLLVILVDLKYEVFRKPRGKDLAFALPFLILVVNNFPFASVILKDAHLVYPAGYVAVFVLSCLAVGFSEEIAFRGIVFNYLLAEKGEKPVLWAVIVQAVVFALMHVFNLFFGAGIGSVLLQIGYTFLIGAMLAIVLYRTRNIWICIILHTIYNFGGMLLPTLGTGSWPHLITVIITVVISLIVTAYVFTIIIKDKLYKRI